MTAVEPDGGDGDCTSDAASSLSVTAYTSSWRKTVSRLHAYTCYCRHRPIFLSAFFRVNTDFRNTSSSNANARCEYFEWCHCLARSLFPQFFDNRRGAPAYSAKIDAIFQIHMNAWYEPQMLRAPPLGPVSPIFYSKSHGIRIQAEFLTAVNYHVSRTFV